MKGRKNWQDDPTRQPPKRRALDSVKRPIISSNQTDQSTEGKVLGDSEKLHLSLNLSIPKLRLSRLTKKQKQLGLLVFVLLLVSVGGFKIAVYLFNRSPDTGEMYSKADQSLNFDPLSSPQKNQAMPGPSLAFDPNKKVASFKDKIAGVEVTVSQQVLPANFKEKPEEEVEKLAKNFKATKLIYAKDVKAFSGTSSEDGSQTVIFTKKDLLIFIRAVEEVDRDGLVQYIIDLK